MDPRSIVQSFVDSLAETLKPDRSLQLTVSTEGALNFPGADQTAAGPDCIERLSGEEKFDLIVVDLPLGMGRQASNIGNTELKVRRNWALLANALTHLAPGGLCVALLEPPAFGLADGPDFLKALQSEGYHFSGVFNAPPSLLTTTAIRPVLVAFRFGPREDLFAGELEDKTQAAHLAQAFLQDDRALSLADEVDLPPGDFSGFESLNAELQLQRLETQYKQYKTFALDELAEEFVSVASGDTLEHKPNAIYIPTLGTTSVAHDLSDVKIKHQNIVQVILKEEANSEFVAAFFGSALGRLVLKGLQQGAVIPKIRKSDLRKAQVALPELAEQEEIVLSYKRVDKLSQAICELQQDLALNPRNAIAIRQQAENMLEQIGGLSEAEQVLSLARAGESRTTEFKESFSLDVKKGEKAKHLELASLKTIAAFLNTQGGTLLVGISDSGEAVGVNAEIQKLHKSSADKFLLHFKNGLKTKIGEEFYPFIDQRLVAVSGAQVLQVVCRPSPEPCYLEGEEFYVRTNPATDQLTGRKLVEYVRNHFQE